MAGGEQWIDQTATDAEREDTYDGRPFFAVFARDEDPKWDGSEKSDKKREEGLPDSFLFGE